MVTELLQKYIWLVNTFIRAGERGLSLTEITDKWEDRFSTPYSRRTFNNHREAVEEVFGIRIECDRSTNRYFVGYSQDVSDENAENAWLINTFTVNNILRLSKERLSGRVSVEDIPSGHRHLTSVMEAMTENVEINHLPEIHQFQREQLYIASICSQGARQKMVHSRILRRKEGNESIRTGQDQEPIAHGKEIQDAS